MLPKQSYDKIRILINETTVNAWEIIPHKPNYNSNEKSKQNDPHKALDIDLDV